MTNTYQQELSALTERLASTSKQSPDQARNLHRQAVAEAMPKMMAGQTYGEAMGGPAILNQDEDSFRTELKTIDNDLGRQIGIVSQAFEDWLTKGEQPAPYYAWRIAVILGKAKRKEEEFAFLNAWCKHFGTVVGARYESIARRAGKMGAL